MTTMITINKCIGDDTKAAACQSLNCIKNKKNKMCRKNDFQYAGWNSYTLQCGTITTFIRQVTAPAMWHVALES